MVSELNNKTIDIKGGLGNPGDSLVMMPLKMGKRSQQWRLDAQGFIRSAINDYAIEMGFYTFSLIDG